MDGVTIDRLVTDALLLDAVDGLDSVAGRLADIYDSVSGCWDKAVMAESLGGILAELGWWSGRLKGAVSTETAAVVERLASDEA